MFSNIVGGPKIQNFYEKMNMERNLMIVVVSTCLGTKASEGFYGYFSRKMMFLECSGSQILGLI